MKAFTDIVINTDQCRREILAFHDFLAGTADLSEKKDILPFFRKSPQLSAYCGYYNPKSIVCDRVAWEYDLFGDFACDLVVGDSVRKSFTFVEFEDAGPKSLFVKQGKKATRAWSSRLDQGYSQIIDWFYKLDDRRNSDDYETRFGKRSIDYSGLLIVGRDRYMNEGERLRLEWRREHVIVHSRKIHCVTFDELAVDLLARLESTLPEMRADR